MGNDELIERLWANDEASALTNQAAREIERLNANRTRWVSIHDRLPGENFFVRAGDFWLDNIPTPPNSAEEPER